LQNHGDTTVFLDAASSSMLDSGISSN